MKDNGLITICIITVIFVSSVIAIKYNNLKLANQKLQKQNQELLEKCKQEKDTIQEELKTIKVMEADYCVLWEENQIFASMLSEVENMPGGHDQLQDLWQKYKK